MLLGNTAQPRAHPHELQQAVHPVGHSDVGEPDLRATTKRKHKEEKKRGERTTAASTDGRQEKKKRGQGKRKERKGTCQLIK